MPCPKYALILAATARANAVQKSYSIGNDVLNSTNVHNKIHNRISFILHWLIVSSTVCAMLKFMVWNYFKTKHTFASIVFWGGWCCFATFPLFVSKTGPPIYCYLRLNYFVFRPFRFCGEFIKSLVFFRWHGCVSVFRELSVVLVVNCPFGRCRAPSDKHATSPSTHIEHFPNACMHVMAYIFINIMCKIKCCAFDSFAKTLSLSFVLRAASHLPRHIIIK